MPSPSATIWNMMFDLKARQVVIASLLYYGLDAPLMSDADFDKLCIEVADNWDKLDPMRQWQLGSPEGIRASGNFVKVTVLAADAAADMMFRAGKTKYPAFYHTEPWHYDESMKVRWLYATAFRIK